MFGNHQSPNPQTGRSFLSKMLLSFLILLAVTDLQTIAAITPQIAEGLETCPITVTYSFVAYSLSAVFAALLLRKYSSQLGKTQLLPVIALIYGVSCALAAFSPNVAFFIFSRALGGVAGGFISALAITALAEVTSYEKRGKNMSLISFSYYMAPMIGVPFSTFLTQSYNWRVVFIVTSGLIFLTGFLIQMFPVSRREVLETGESSHEYHNLSKSLRMGIVSAFFVSGGLVGFMTFIGTWLFDVMQASPQRVGFAYALMNVGALVGGISGGFLADRFSKRSIALHPNILMAFCLFSLPLLYWANAVVLMIVVVAFAAALRVAPLQALLTELALPSSEEISSYIATRNVSSQLGIGFSILVCGQLYFNYGLAGVSIACAILTVGAWFTIRAISEPTRRQKESQVPVNPIYE